MYLSSQTLSQEVVFELMEVASKESSQKEMELESQNQSETEMTVVIQELSFELMEVACSQKPSQKEMRWKYTQTERPVCSCKMEDGGK